MPVTPTGPISLPLASAQSLLANCAAFRAWTDSADVAAAKAKIYLVDLPPASNATQEYTAEELAALRPLARLDLFEPEAFLGGQPYVADRVGEGGGAYRDSGKLALDLEASIDPADERNYADAKLKFLNDVGGILLELRQTSGETNYLSDEEIAAGLGGIAFHRIELYRLYRSDQTVAATMGSFWRVTLLLHWAP